MNNIKLAKERGDEPKSSMNQKNQRIFFEKITKKFIQTIKFCSVLENTWAVDDFTK